jgi:superfamily II DNA or RNA helicase
MYIISAVGEVIYRVPAQDLIDAKLISRPTINFIPVPVSPIPKRGAQWNTSYRKCIVEAVARNKVLTRLAEKARHPCLMFVKHEKHGKALLKMLKDRGNVSCEFVHGKWSMKRREEVIKKLRWGDLDVAICTKIWQTGTDIPELASMVIGTGGASNIEAVQRVGRGTRVVHDSEGNVVKDEVEVWEIYDEDPKAKNPNTGRMNKTKAAWFQDHSKSRMESYQQEGYPVHLLTPLDAIRFTAG